MKPPPKLENGSRPEPRLSVAICDPSLLTRSRVMIVDDHAPNVMVLERLLEMAGLENLEGFTDAELALERCIESVPDLLLLDLRMPRLDGFGVMAALRSALPVEAFLPVLVLTADNSTETMRQALAAGAKDVLTKPFDATEVILRVRNLLETKDLYARLQRHNAELQAELDDQLAQDRQEAADYAEREQRVAEALARNVSMVYQPIVSLEDGRLIGVEALARFDIEPHRPPNEWFADAAAVGRGEEMELRAVESGLAQLDELPDDLYMSINASPAAAVGLGLTTLLDTYPGDRIVLELTEHTRVQNYNALREALDLRRTHGVRIAVDDTGAGYAGLQHLLHVRPNVVKLDIALTRNIDADPARRALASALVAFANEIGAVLIAEGVESPGELRTLRELGISAAQGYHLARPGPMSELREDYANAFAP